MTIKGWTGMQSKSKMSLVVFFVIAFGIPWIGWTLMNVLDLSHTTRMSLLFFGDFCSIGGFIAAFFARRKEGVITLLRRVIRFKFSPIWWVIAVAIPFFYMTVAFVLGSYSEIGRLGELEPANLLFLLTPTAFAMFLTGPLGEEFGWRGFLLPKFLEKFTPFIASIILGILWAIWYFPLYMNSIFGSFYSGFVFVVHIVFMSIIMTIIFLNTRGSLFVSILYRWLVAAVQFAFAMTFISTTSNFEPFQNVGELIVIGILIATQRERMFQKYDGELLFFKDRSPSVETATGNP